MQASQPTVLRSIKARVAGRIGSLIVDSASTLQAGGPPWGLVVVFDSTALPSPVVLDVLLDLADNTAETAAAAIREVLRRYEIDPATQIVQCMGDDLSWNDALADQLGVSRAQCVSHTLSFVAKAAARTLGSVEILTSALGTVLDDGGMFPRTKDLSRYALKEAGGHLRPPPKDSR
jgi:hypothetical protein